MLKLFSLLNITGLFLFKMFFITDVVVTQELPATMQAGSEVRVTVMIDKDKLAGFAKLQIDLPEGLSASAIETKGASFTFAEGKAKFIWMALPTAPRFEVSYTLIAAANASGSMPITGKFSYIEDNERKTKDLASATVIITNEAAAQDNSTQPKIDVATTQPPAEQVMAPPVETTTQQVPVQAPPTENATATEPPAATNEPAAAAQRIAGQQGAGNVSSSRVITPVTENEMLVEVTVNKGDLRGFGKLQEQIPAGFTALEKNSAEAIFTTQDRVVKFVWLNLPAKSELKVIYKLRGVGVPEAEYMVNGEFGYLLSDETQKAVTGTTSFWTGAKALEQIAAMNAQNNAGQTAQTTEPQNTGDQTTQQTQNTQENATASKPTKPKTHVGGPETGVSYKVQISAAHREVGAAYFAERHHYTGEFSIEHNAGWIKYVTGRFDNYRGAKDQRQAYVDGGYNFPGPFVTAYNNGDRITVQEALMISNQKWIQ